MEQENRLQKIYAEESQTNIELQTKKAISSVRDANKRIREFYRNSDKSSSDSIHSENQTLTLDSYRTEKYQTMLLSR